MTKSWQSLLVLLERLLLLRLLVVVLWREKNGEVISYNVEEGWFLIMTKRGDF
jgi:hypothetical protein